MECRLAFEAVGEAREIKAGWHNLRNSHPQDCNAYFLVFIDPHSSQRFQRKATQVQI